MATRLNTIEICGFKSIGDKASVDLGDVTVFLGANGSGKSNLVSFFRMLGHISSGALQKFVAESGMANAVLHFGSEKTKGMSFALNFSDGEWQDRYRATLSYFAPDGLFFTEEQTCAQKQGCSTPICETLPSAGRMESQLEVSSIGNRAYAATRRAVLSMLKGCKAYQFHNTSPDSAIRASCYIDQGHYLRGDAANLPAFLYAMKHSHPAYYQRIETAVREMVPQFRRFVLEPSSGNSTRIFLNWEGEAGDQYLLGPHQFSDGSIRFIALASLLLQPEENLPSVIVLDEPELGLHPVAVQSLAGMIDIASRHCQIVLSTQSAELASFFNPEDVRIVDYDQTRHSSTFKPLPLDELRGWLEEYSLAELWEKNLLGGRP